jgi:glycosyltransferase involved in cell wall biosynthesis
MALYALSEGCPVIAAKCAAVPELIRNGENGLLYSPDNPASLGELLSRLRSETGLSLRIISSGIKTVGEHSWDATVEAVFSAVDSLDKRD